MPSEPLVITYFDNFVKVLGDMSQANGYHLNYGGVVEGQFLWEAEESFLNPVVQAFVVPVVEGAPHGGERSGRTTRQEAQFMAMVHVKSDSGDAVRVSLRVEADIYKAAMADRNRGVGAGGIGRPNTFHEGTEFLYVTADGKEVLGATVVATFRVRWDHVTGDRSDDGS